MLYKMIRPSTMKALHLVGAAAIGAASAAGFAQVPATRMMDSPTNAGTFHYGGHIFAGPVLGAAAGSYEEEMARPGTTAPVTLAAAYGKFHHQLERGRTGQRRACSRGGRDDGAAGQVRVEP